MRKSVLFAIIFGLLINYTSAQQSELTKVDRIYYTCKIWGYLKYYHPLVSKGVFDWDAKMLNVLRLTSDIKTHESLSGFYARWIYNIGQVPPCSSCNQRSNEELFLKNFDLSWTQDPQFTDQLRKTLKNIERNRVQNNNHYVEKGSIGEFIPQNEKQHLDLSWKDEYQRLLPLIRYWNYIEYFYPYKYQIDQSWDDVLREMIPKFLEVNSKEAWHLAMLELIVKIGDSHAGLITNVLDQMPYYNYLPAKIEIIEDQAIVTEIIDSEKAQMADLQVGDIIKTVNNQSVRDIHNSNKKYIWGSNDAVKDRSIYHTLFMGLQGPVQATIERAESTRSTSLNLYKYADITYAKTPPKPTWTSPKDSIGYVNLGALTTADVRPMMEEFMDKTVIIFDIRNNPKGTYKALAKYLNPSDTVFARYIKPDFNYPGKFVWSGEAKCGQANENYYKGQVILLVDENTQSHAEFTCMSLQTAPNVITVGSQTAGTNGKVSKFPIYARHYTAMSGMGVFYPNQREAQRVGMQIDVDVNPTIDGVRAGRDEILEKAMEIAQEEINRTIAEAKAALAAQLALDSLRMDSLRMDSLRMDSLRLIPMKMDSLEMDTLSNDGNN